MTEPFFVTRGVSKRFGGLRALDAVDLDLVPGEIHSVIGPNGAGKTTLFNCITGIYAPSSGRVRLRNRDITGLPSYRITTLGLARTFQNIRLFGEMTALENVMVGCHSRTKAGWFSAILHWGPAMREERDIQGLAATTLEFTGLSSFADTWARNLPYGDQRRLEIARALASSPSILLLDEPAAGMNPEETGTLMELIRKIRDGGVTIILIEHDMKVVMGISDRITVLDHGIKIAEGTPDEVRANPRVITAYLGAADDDEDGEEA
jgi:branched-chain amino acid transport system ATP-binding protein